VLSPGLFWAAAATTAWVYGGYPAALVVGGRLWPRPRRRASITPSVSVVIAAHDEERVIGTKVANVRASSYPPDRVEIVVASDGSRDGTVGAARSAGADVVLDLPRTGKIMALNAAVPRCSSSLTPTRRSRPARSPGS
jgi:biofilm PGA synthesis N-glycosyltransferase PgaC